jgi:hypothetical protein
MTSIQNPSLPKDRIKVLLLEGISDTAVAALRSAGYSNVERLAKALDGEALKTAVKGVRDRGRDGDCSPPPAQIRAGRIPAHGSYLECLTAKRTFGHG